MAEIIADTTWNEPGHGGRQPKYPWPTWLDGKTRALKRGDDFEASVVSLAGAARAWAGRHGIKVRTKMLDKDTLIMQAIL
jgi:hypothetical protein